MAFQGIFCQEKCQWQKWWRKGVSWRETDQERIKVFLCAKTSKHFYGKKRVNITVLSFKCEFLWNRCNWYVQKATSTVEANSILPKKQTDEKLQSFSHVVWTIKPWKWGYNWRRESNWKLENGERAIGEKIEEISFLRLCRKKPEICIVGPWKVRKIS